MHLFALGISESIMFPWTQAEETEETAAENGGGGGASSSAGGITFKHVYSH